MPALEPGHRNILTSHEYALIEAISFLIVMNGIRSLTCADALRLSELLGRLDTPTEAPVGQVVADVGPSGTPTVVLEAMQQFERLGVRSLVVAEVARRAGCSRSHLSTMFRRHVGLSPAAWHRSRKLQKAADMIRSGTKIEAAALLVGFSSRSAMNHAFQKLFRRTPSSFRNGSP